MSKASEILGKDEGSAKAAPARRRGASVTEKLSETTFSVDAPQQKKQTQRLGTPDPAAERRRQRLSQSAPGKAAAARKAPAEAPKTRKKSAKKKSSGASLARTILSHAAIVLALMLLVLIVIDRINNAMEFINNDMTKALMAILSLLAIVNAEIALYFERKKH